MVFFGEKKKKQWVPEEKKFKDPNSMALVLGAVEDTIREQNEDLVPLAYFGAMVCLVSGAFPTLNGCLEKCPKNTHKKKKNKIKLKKQSSETSRHR